VIARNRIISKRIYSKTRKQAKHRNTFKYSHNTPLD
jgi:hypothetical protein